MRPGRGMTGSGDASGSPVDPGSGGTPASGAASRPGRPAGQRESREARFERLYRESSGRVYGLCLRMCGDPALAEEIAQEAFVKAWEKLDTFRGEARITTWMHRLTVNVALNTLRGRKRRPATGEDPEVLERLGGGTEDGAPVDRIALERAVRQLPERARMVFALYDVEGYPQEEIAEMMGTSVGTVKSQLHRARQLLREELRA